jgi:signal transduction histidine kinase
MTYQTMKKHEEAIYWINKALKIEETGGNPVRIAMRMYNLATSHASLKNYQTAEKLFLQVDSLISGTTLYVLLAKNNTGLGQLYFVQNRFNEALNYFSKAEYFAEQAGTLPEKSNVALHFYQIYKKMENHSEALKYYERYTILNDSVYNLTVARQIEELQVQHQTAQKEAEITRLETDNELKQNELVYRKRERNWALLAIIVLLGFSTTIFFLFRQVKSQKSILAHQNTELDKLNKTLNRLFGIISHDLRNATAAYQSSSKIMAHHLKNGQPEKLLPLAPEIEKNATQLSSLLENLLNWSAAQIKGIQPEKEQINIKSAIEQTLVLFEEKNQQKNNRVELKADDEKIWCDPESFQIIFRNLLGNAVKFTSNGSITIQCAQNEDSTEISVSDTGCGMDPATVNNLNNAIFSESRRGTLGEKGTGLGFILAAEHIAKNGGAFEVKSTPNAGTTISVKFKNKQ